MLRTVLPAFQDALRCTGAGQEQWTEYLLGCGWNIPSSLASFKNNPVSDCDMNQPSQSDQEKSL